MRPPLNQRPIQTGQTPILLHNKTTTLQKPTTIANVLHKDTPPLRIADQATPRLPLTPVLLIAETQTPPLQEVLPEATTPPLHALAETAHQEVVIPPLHVPAEAVHPAAVAVVAAAAVDAPAEAVQAVVAVVIDNNSNNYHLSYQKIKSI